MRGLYNQRSGMALSPSFADYTKPLDLHPDGGTKTTHSTFRAIDGGNANYAARFARILANYDPELSETYRVSALKAFAWGQKGFKAAQASGAARKARALAAVELYRLTREEGFQDLFKAVTFLNKEDPLGHGRNLLYDSYFAYASLPDEMADPALKAKVIAAIKALGDHILAYAGGNAFNVSTSNIYKPPVHRPLHLSRCYRCRPCPSPDG